MGGVEGTVNSGDESDWGKGGKGGGGDRGGSESGESDEIVERGRDDKRGDVFDTLGEELDDRVVGKGLVEYCEFVLCCDTGLLGDALRVYERPSLSVERTWLRRVLSEGAPLVRRVPEDEGA